MASRVGLVTTLLLVTAFSATATAARQPPTGAAMFVVRHDPRLCPSPMCGGYWVALANGARTRCADGLRHVRCYAARAVDAKGSPLGDIAEGGLVRGAVDAGRDDLGELVVTAVYEPAGSAPVAGGYYRVVDTGIRCVRAPCFSFRASQVNGSTRIALSGVDVAAAKATAKQLARANAAPTDEGRPLRPWRLFERTGPRPRLPRSSTLPQGASAARLSTSQARRTSSSVVRKLPTASRST